SQYQVLTRLAQFSLAREPHVDKVETPKAAVSMAKKTSFVVVVLTAALSVYNSCVYCNSRMLFGLAQQGNAPKALASVDKRGV
ncbi:regulatory signaling modulator protein AmpE, partial [Escherichia coli]|uniref:regulatory signaling modulator protein AmpE n=1 Tax=Escherichia coli TaxID=562 RepID=UPI001E60D0F0